MLAVLELPSNPVDWVESTAESMVLRRRLWWESLFEFPEIDSGSRTIVIPETQYLDLGTLDRLMDRVRQKLPLKG